MSEFIENNKRMLQIYYFVALIIGWALIAVSPLGTIVAFSGNESLIENALVILYILQGITLNPLILGLLLLGTAQFIRCVAETEYKPGWILQNGSTVLYAAAFIVIMSCLVNYLYLVFSFSENSFQILKFFLSFITSLIPALAKVLILVGLGKILRRILPVIEESKTLV
jgi:hypothetical protein